MFLFLMIIAIINQNIPKLNAVPLLEILPAMKQITPAIKQSKATTMKAIPVWKNFFITIFLSPAYFTDARIDYETVLEIDRKLLG